MPCTQLVPSGVFIVSVSFVYISSAEAELRVGRKWCPLQPALRKSWLPWQGLRQMLLLLIFLTPAAVRTPATTWGRQIVVTMKQIFECNKVSQGHAPFLPLDPVQHQQLKRMKKRRRNCKICYEKQGHKAEPTSPAPLAMFAFAFCCHVAASLSGTTVKATGLTGLQRSSTWCRGLMYILKDI